VIRRCILVALCVAAGCSRDTSLGALDCAGDLDCAVPASICGADARCVPGCGLNPMQCVAGSVCDAQLGECGGAGIVGASCADDAACDPPDVVCRPSTHNCVAGCTLAGFCAEGTVCDAHSGHCCDSDLPGCLGTQLPNVACNSDADCMPPATICSGGACVAGCGTTGCSAPQTCSSNTGHCTVALCARDTDCDADSYCSQAASCTALSYGGKNACNGGKTVYYRCAVEETAATFDACVGPAAMSGCGYCLDNSCMHPGLCSSEADCHRGDSCVDGLCRVQAPECPTTVTVSDVSHGVFAAGKEVCVRDTVTAVRNGYDGMIDIKLGTSPYLFVDVMPMYEHAGVRIPTVGQAVTVHGTVRWDGGHSDWELLPVDWISPP
jgi:hypothetical protein